MENGECLSVLDSQCIYFGLAISLPIALCTFANGGRRFMLRPQWLYINILHVFVKNRNIIAAAAELSLIYAGFNSHSFLARSPFFLGVRFLAVVLFGAFALHHNATVGTHFEMLAVWSLVTLLLPSGFERIAILRILCWYSVAGPGMTKCFIAGLRWASAENIRIMNNEFSPSVALKQSIQKTPDLVLNIAGLLGLIFETFAPLLFLYVSTESENSLLFYSFVTFHTGCLILVGMFFVHHIPVYAGALFGGSFASLTISGWLLFCFLILVSLFKVEIWPVSCMGLFPYNDIQTRDFKVRFGGKLRLIGTTSSKTLNQGENLRSIGGLDLIAWALHASVPLDDVEWEGDGRFGCPTYWAAPWFDLSIMDLEKRPQEAIQAAIKSLGSQHILYETGSKEAISVFSVVQVGDDYTIEKVIATSSTMKCR